MILTIKTKSPGFGVIKDSNIDLLSNIHVHFSFINKAAQNQLKRFKDGLFYKERAIAANNNGDLPDNYLSWKQDAIKELQSKVLVYCTVLEEGKITIPIGLIPSLMKFLNEQNITLTIKDERDFDLGKKHLVGIKPKKLRKPQEEALKLLTEFKTDLKGIGLIRLATGVGKTDLGQELIRSIGLKAIFLVPSLPILKQTIKRFEAAFGKKEVKAFGGGVKKLGYVTVATYQSVYKADPSFFDNVSLALFDEVHHVSAETFYDVATVKLKNCIHRYGLTAFEERADNTTMLIESAVGPVVYSYDAPQAIEDGYLARPTYFIYDVWETSGTWTKYKTIKGKRTAVGIEKSVQYEGHDDLIAYRNWVLGNDKLNQFVADLANLLSSENQSILILVDEKEHGERLMKLIPHAGFAIGGSKDNERLQREFNDRKLKVLIGTSTLGEGADTIAVDVLIELQGGASKSKTLQADGRALRNDPDPETGIPRKPETTIIDFNFPLSKILSRHSQMREQVHKTMGQIHRGKIS